MSTYDSGRGRKAGPTPEFQSDFANRQSPGSAPQTWGANALDAQKSEVAFMGQGAGRPGQPGQRSIFGGGGPVFVQMPTYTPVTRGPAPKAPKPPQQPSFAPYPASQPAPQIFQNAFASQPVQLAPQPVPAPAPSFPNLQTAGAPSYQAPDFQPQGYHANQPQSAPSFSPAEHPGAQAYSAPGYNGAAGQGYQGQSFQPQAYPDAGYGDASFPETGTQDASYVEPKFAEQDFGDANFADASFKDASFPDTNVGASNTPFSHLETGLDGGFGAQHAQPDHGFDPLTEEATEDYVMASQGVGSGQVPPSDPRRQLQAFDALYDQPPQIALGSTDPTRRAPQDFYDSERMDADFMDEGQVAPPAGTRSKMAATLKSKSAFMVGSALLGAIALGGALAFVYKQSGGGIGSEPPVVTADNRPVKEVPDQPGGKEFPHKNKLIYDRLTNGDDQETDHLVPRQEDVAVPALPPAQTGTAGLPTPVATTDQVSPPATQAIDETAGASPLAIASTDDSADGGPRRVKTLKVRPDGSVEGASSAQASAAADSATATRPVAAPAPAATMPVPAAEPPAPQQVANVEPALAKPKAPKPVATQASATPATGSTKYVVQVGSKKNQTEALASFADMQQKYPSLIGSYRPMVQKADLGAKGVWYRLRIGPIADKAAAAKLCSQLKAQGLPDCLVATQ
jgi:cell division septation protein DedD